MNTKILKTMPKSGQFVAMWEHNNDVWSYVCKWRKGKLHTYSARDDEFVPVGKVPFIKGASRFYVLS